MKIIILSILFLLSAAFVGVQYFAMKSQKNIETYPYKVIKKFDNFEVRSYKARLFSSVDLKTSTYDEASSEGFSILAAYIFGGNKDNQKIEMTSPVVMTLADTMTMMFMIPNELEKANLPKPNSSQIEFKEEPQKIVAATTFGGWANDEKIAEHKEKLVQDLYEEDIEYTDSFFFLGYNPPYELTNRRNEVIVELVNYTP